MDPVAVRTDPRAAPNRGLGAAGPAVATETPISTQRSARSIAWSAAAEATTVGRRAEPGGSGSQLAVDPPPRRACTKLATHATRKAMLARR